jgi:hypothetical protein
LEGHAVERKNGEGIGRRNLEIAPGKSENARMVTEKSPFGLTRS